MTNQFYIVFSDHNAIKLVANSKYSVHNNLICLDILNTSNKL